MFEPKRNPRPAATGQGGLQYQLELYPTFKPRIAQPNFAAIYLQKKYRVSPRRAALIAGFAGLRGER